MYVDHPKSMKPWIPKSLERRDVKNHIRNVVDDKGDDDVGSECSAQDEEDSYHPSKWHHDPRNPSRDSNNDSKEQTQEDADSNNDGQEDDDEENTSNHPTTTNTEETHSSTPSNTSESPITSDLPTPLLHANESPNPASPASVKSVTRQLFTSPLTTGKRRLFLDAGNVDSMNRSSKRKGMLWADGIPSSASRGNEFEEALARGTDRKRRREEEDDFDEDGVDSTNSSPRGVVRRLFAKT